MWYEGSGYGAGKLDHRRGVGEGTDGPLGGVRSTPAGGARGQLLAQEKAGILIYICGGDGNTFTEAIPAMGGTYSHIGEAGSRAKINLAVNILWSILQAALAKILGMAKHGDIAPLFPFNLMKNDLDYALAAARVKGLPLAQATRYVLTETMDADQGEYNMSGGVQL